MTDYYIKIQSRGRGICACITKMCRPTGKSIELRKMKTEYKAKKFNEEIELMSSDNPNIVENKGNYFVLPDYHVKN